MSNLSELFPAGAGKQVSFVASGNIGNGNTVILNSDGTVTAVSGQSGALGSATNYGGGGTNITPQAVYDANAGKIVMAWEDANLSEYGYAVVGTVSGTTITFGTAVAYKSGRVGYTSIAYDANAQKVFIAYTDFTSSEWSYGIVGTVSGTSLSFGSAGLLMMAISSYHECLYDPDRQKVLVTMGGLYSGIFLAPRAVAVTISGTGFSSTGVYNITNTEMNNRGSLSYDTVNDKFVFIWSEQGNANRPAANVIEVTQFGLNIGAKTEILTRSATIFTSTYHTSLQRTVFIFRDSNNSNNETVKLGAISGTTISFGADLTTETGNASSQGAEYYADGNNIVFTYENSSTSAQEYRTLSVTLTSATFSDATEILSTYYQSNQGPLPILAYDSSNDRFVAGSGRQVAVLKVPYTNVTSGNFLGISDGAISSASSGSVTIKGGVSTNVSGLTPASNYYVQNDGSLSTTLSDVLAGKALSATSVDLDYST